MQQNNGTICKYAVCRNCNSFPKNSNKTKLRHTSYVPCRHLNSNISAKITVLIHHPHTANFLKVEMSFCIRSAACGFIALKCGLGEYSEDVIGNPISCY